MSSFKLIAFGMALVCFIKAWFIFKSPTSFFCFLQTVPRHVWIGRIGMAINLGWGIFLFHQMDFGDWNHLRDKLMVVSPVFLVLVLIYGNDFLGARAIAMFMILAAKPILDLCFLNDSLFRLVLVSLSYMGIIAGLFIFAMPWYLRDGIAFIKDRPHWIKPLGYLQVVVALALLSTGIWG